MKKFKQKIINKILSKFNYKKTNITSKIINFSLLILIFSNIYIFFNPYQISLSNYINTLTTNTNIVKNDLNQKLEKEISNLNINSKNYIIFDRNSNSTLFGKNINERVKMASTTKIMTALVILNFCPLDEIVEISKKAANTGGSRVGLKTGDKISISDLLYGLMLCSGNDAAVALAEHCSETTSNFCAMMNTMAQNLGLCNTNFESPHGLDSENHYTTAYELAFLTDYALENKTFSKIVGTKTYTININSYSKTISNTNELLGKSNGIYGVKTGFTNGANICLVSSCKRNEMDIISIVLGADTKNYRTKDSIKLLDYAFENFAYINIQDIYTLNLDSWKETNIINTNNNSDYFTIEKAKSSNLTPIFDTIPNNLLSILKTDINNIYCNIEMNTYLSAPIYKGQIIGKADIFNSDNLIYSLNILSDSNINKKNSLFYILDFFSNYITYLNTII